MNFKDYLSSERDKTNHELDLFLKGQIDIAKDLDEEFAQSVQAMSQHIMTGGKRLRPLLVRLAYELSGGEEHLEIVKASSFVELMHEFILVHDDFCDRDLLRHGQPTLEAVFGSRYQDTFGRPDEHFGASLAIIAGDLIHVWAHQLLQETNFSWEVKARATLLQNKTLTEVISGWHIHFWQNARKLSEVDEARYLEGMRLVSASYTIESPLAMGITLAGKQTSEFPLLAEFAYHAGMAFQIQDDILGVFGDSQTTGKPAGNDIREGKKTLLVLRAYKTVSSTQQQLLAKAVGNAELTPDSLEEIKEIIDTSGSLNYSKQKAQEHTQKALSALTNLAPKDHSAIIRLQELAAFVINRSL